MDRQIPNWLAHHGVQGQKWGIKHGPPYPIGSHPRKVFVSGTSKFKGKLPKEITSKLDNYIQNNYHVLIGDAPGIDTEVQKYLARKNHRNVTIYTIEDKPRFQATNDLGWGVKKVEAPESEMVDGYNPSQVYKDKAMAKDAHVGLAIPIENGAKATRKNIERLEGSGKSVDVIELGTDGYNSEQKNVNSCGKSKDNNILYISGKAGTGKSSKALSMSNNVIHLDFYFEPGYEKYQSKDFNKYLKQHFPNYKDLLNKDKNFGKNLEKFENVIQDYGKYAFNNGESVVVEGLQLLDGTLFPDSNYFNDKPYILMTKE